MGMRWEWEWEWEWDGMGWDGMGWEWEWDGHVWLIDGLLTAGSPVSQSMEDPECMYVCIWINQLSRLRAFLLATFPGACISMFLHGCLSM